MIIENGQELSMRSASVEDLPRFQAIRAAAFAPVFTSFRSLLGDDLYRLVQADEDERQADLLADAVDPASAWEVHVGEVAGCAVGFISIALDHETLIGEIGLNAVRPEQAGQGIGTAMYEFAVLRMKAAGMRAASVSTGADESHAAARRAYRKAGFTAQIPSVWMCRKL